MFKLDIQDAYLHVPLSPQFSAACGVGGGVEGLAAEWAALPFGMSWSPWVFQTVLAAALRPVRLTRGQVLYQYLDDLLFTSPSKEEAEDLYLRVTSHLLDLGWTLALNKCVPPTQKLEFLGWTWDTVCHTAVPSSARVTSIRTQARRLLSRKTCSLRDVQSLHGAVSTSLHLLMHDQLLVRPLQTEITQWSSVKGLVRGTLSAESRVSLRHWKSWAPIPLSLGSHAHVIEVCSDASDTGWGGVLMSVRTSPSGEELLSAGGQKLAPGLETRGFFPSGLHAWRIEAKEVLAALWTLHALVPPTLRVGSTVRLWTDSTVALAYLSRFKGGRVPYLNSLLAKTAKWFRSRRWRLEALWVPSAQNAADRPSRAPKEVGAVMLRSTFVTWALEALGLSLRDPFTSMADLFASRSNRQAQVFASRHPQPGCSAVDPLQGPLWKLLTRLRGRRILWCNPPWTLWPQVVRWLTEAVSLSHLLPYSVTIVTIFPEWKTAPWHRALSGLVTRKCLLPLALRDNVSTRGHSPTRNGLVGPYLDCWGLNFPAPAWRSCCALLPLTSGS